MVTNNVQSGIGAQRDEALASGGRRRRNTPTAYNSGIDRERAVFPLMLNEGFGHRDFSEGDLVSMKARKIVPLDPSLEFAGIIEKVGEERGVYVASICTRGAVCVKVHGLNATTGQGTPVYALPSGSTQVFTLDKQGVLVGEVCAIENSEREMATVGIRQPHDSRPFWLGGPRPSRG